MKTIALAALASSVAVATPASAGVYVNVENNGTRLGSQYLGSTTDLHVGYEGGTDKFGFYVQGGPAIVDVQGDSDQDWRLSGKAGGNFVASEKLDIYGELSFLTSDEDLDIDNSWGTKLGAKFKF